MHTKCIIHVFLLREQINSKTSFQVLEGIPSKNWNSTQMLSEIISKIMGQFFLNSSMGKEKFQPNS